MSHSSRKSDSISSIVVAVVAIVLLASHLYDRQNGAQARTSPPTREITGWREASVEGIWLGPKDAPIVITEFVDFQCPFCAQAGPLLEEILTTSTDVALVLQHMPLRNHPHALPAAVAVECATGQERTVDIIRVMFQKQDSLGIKSWRSYAEEAAVPFLDTFEACAELPSDSFPRIARGRAIAEEHGVSGTPTLWVNEWVTTKPQLTSHVKDLRKKIGRE